jgi:Cu+-exporting ATPase
MDRHAHHGCCSTHARDTHRHEHAGSHGHQHRHAPAAPGVHMAKDPVCGMDVDPHTAKHQHEHAGRTHYFCSAGCRTKFAADPDRYLGDRDPEPGPPGATYTCPMHPEVRQVGPGSCPICGMALEPLEVTADAGPNAELADMTRRLWVALALALPVFLLEMGGHLFDLHALLSRQASNWLQLLLATPVVLWAGLPFFERGWASLKSRNLNMFTLIALGPASPGPTASSRPWRPASSPAGFRGHDGSVAGLLRGRGGRHRPGARRARCSSCARGSARAAPSGRSSTWHPRRRGASARTATTRTR